MGVERYYWRSDPASDPVQLPGDWARPDDERAQKRPSRFALGRFVIARIMKNDVARAYFEAERESKIALRGFQQVPALRAAGAPTHEATVGHIHDTGATINDNPVLVLTIETGGRQADVVALVPRIAVPRPGEKIEVIASPDGPTLMYVGLKSPGR
ncbi:MAG: hypothetical protein ACTH31_01880 [Pseudoclavibacter sp.]